MTTNKNSLDLNCSLMFTSESMSLIEMERLINIPYNQSGSKGEKRITPNGDWLGTYYSFSYFSVFSSLNTEDIGTHLSFLLNMITPLDRQIKEFYSLSSDNSITIKIFVSDFTHTGFFLDRNLIKRMSDLGIGLDCDIYGND